MYGGIASKSLLKSDSSEVKYLIFHCVYF